MSSSKVGSRDNFRAKLCLGNISAEQTKMLGLDKSKMTDINSFAGERVSSRRPDVMKVSSKLKLLKLMI